DGAGRVAGALVESPRREHDLERGIAVHALEGLQVGAPRGMAHHGDLGRARRDASESVGNRVKVVADVRMPLEEMLLPAMDERLLQLGSVDADHAPCAIAPVVVAMQAALVLRSRLPAIGRKTREVEVRIAR